MRLSLSTAFLALALRAAGQTNNPDDPTGKILYVNAPACGSYRCVVTWPHGDTVSVNWLGPPPGNVSVALVSNVDGTVYFIVDSYPAISQSGYCNAGNGVGVVIPGVECGMVQFNVPAGWKEASNYTIMVQSLSDSSLVGFTDAITIAASSNNSPDPADTSVTLLTIPAPTSTNLAGSTSFSGKIPRPTAVTDVATAEAATTSASRGTGTGTGMVLGESKAAAPTTMAVGANSGAARVGGAMGAMLGVGAAVALLL